MNTVLQDFKLKVLALFQQDFERISGGWSLVAVLLAIGLGKFKIYLATTKLKTHILLVSSVF